MIMGKGTGGGGAFILNGSSVPFNTIEPSVTKEHDDSTDSTNYDISSGLTHKAQLAVTTQSSFAIEGKIDLSIVPIGIVALLYTNPGALPATFRYNTGTIYGHGLVDVTDFKCTIDPTKTLTYSATLISNGIWAINS
jgi:hypothetical protein